MSIFDNLNPFKSAEPATIAPQPGQPTPPGNVPTPKADGSNPPTEGQGVTPPIPQEAKKPEDDSPLAQFKDLWETDPKKSGDKEAAPDYSLKSEDVMKVVAKQDFTKNLTPEQVAAIQEGGEAGVAATIALVNGAVQQAVTTSTLISNQLSQQMVNQAVQDSQDKIPGILRSNLTSAHLKDTNPLFSNPAVTPVMEAVQSQLLEKYPDFTPQRVNELTENFVMALAEEVNSGAKDAINNNAGGEVDWDAFMKRQ